MASIKKVVDSITVIEGSGNASFNQSGNIINIFVMSPPGSVYDFGIVDEDGFVVYYKINNEGNIADQGRIVIYPGEKNVTIQRATEGVYRIKLIFEE